MRRIFVLLLPVAFFFGSCYSFKDVSIPPEVKTARVNYIENRASYVNPQLSPQLTERLRQKINNQTRLTLITSEEADYDIHGEIRGYNLSTSGVSDQRAASNRLQITVHIVFKNRLDDKASFEADVSRSFDFNSTISLQQAEQQQGEEILRNLTDEIFNRIFSNW
ncbi:MAG: LptE family protein [Chitinophagaceae bacterium]|nr:LptE family protein [Chitinophagaceae bacterium]